MKYEQCVYCVYVIMLKETKKDSSPKKALNKTILKKMRKKWRMNGAIKIAMLIAKKAI